MKLELDKPQFETLPRDLAVQRRVWGETDQLTEVALCSPSFLEAVPCCSATKASLRRGFAVSRVDALVEHRSLVATLHMQGVTCHVLEPAAGMPDLCFVRDVAVMTPWGLVALNPALAHRAQEVDQMMANLAGLDVAPSRRITAGSLEGGDVCVARPGLLVIGHSGERSSREGAEEFAEPFQEAGWDIIHYPFDPHFLHLDTIFCMVDENKALGCVDVLDDWFLQAVERRGIELLPVPYKAARSLGGNVLALGQGKVLVSADHIGVTAMLRRAGLEPIGVDVSQFASCGGGIHCLTLPLNRAPA